MLGKQLDVLVMPHFGRSLRHHGNFHHVKPVGLRAGSQLPHVDRGGATHDGLLALVHRVVTGDQGISGAGFHFDEHQHTTVPAYQVELIAPVAWAAPVASHHDITVLLEKGAGHPFALLAG